MRLSYSYNISSNMSPINIMIELILRERVEAYIEKESFIVNFNNSFPFQSVSKK